VVTGVGVGDGEASLATAFESGAALVVVGCEWANGELGIRVRLRAGVRD